MQSNAMEQPTTLEKSLEYKPISSIPPNESRTFRSPLYTNLVRTGVIGDGNCFFHAVFYSSSHHYRSLSIPERKEFILRLRQDLANETSIQDWKSLGKGEVYRLFVTNVFYKMMTDMKDKLTDPYELWDKTIFPALSNEWKTTSISDCIRIVQHFSKQQELEKIITHIENLAFRQFVEHIRTNWVDDFMIEYLSHLFQRNIYIVDANTRVLYAKPTVTKYAWSIFILYIDEHYESIGVYDSETNTVQREFEATHELVKNTV